MASLPPCAEWANNPKYWYEHMPLPVRQAVGRAIRYIMRWDADTGGDWVDHEQLFERLRVATRYPTLTPVHVHACVEYANSRKPTFNIFYVWSWTEPVTLVGFQYRAVPGSFERRRHDGHQDEQLSRAANTIHRAGVEMNQQH